MIKLVKCHQSSSSIRLRKVILKFRIFIWIALIVLILLTQSATFAYFKLNNEAINISKLSYGASMNTHPKIIFESVNKNSLNCHFQWLGLSLYSESQSFTPNNLIVENLIKCSIVNMQMIRIRYPTEQNFAEMAVHTYPGESFPLYWLSDCIGKGFTSEKKPILERILRINPKDGVAWRILGLIYIEEKNIPEAIQAHINSCNNGDPGSNGCYHAGRLLEQEGKYKEASYFYRLSRWKPSQDAADRLEAELLLKNP